MADIADVIKHAQACKSVGTFIVPEWPSAYFWPFLKTLSSNAVPIVVSQVTLPKNTDIIKPSVFFGCPKLNMLVLKIDFRLGVFSSYVL